jgi:hypothetical protein
METSNLEKRESYSEVYIPSFEEAVEYLKEKTEADESKFCLVDIDGTLFSEDILKLPVISHFINPVLSDSVKESFCSLVSDVFVDENVAIVTNRNSYERVLWNSREIVRVVKEFCNVPVFTFLNKQIPGLNKKGCDNLLYKIMEYAQTREDLTIYSVEDHSFASPFRKHFLEYVAKRVKVEGGVNTDVVNLVIKR